MAGNADKPTPNEEHPYRWLILPSLASAGWIALVVWYLCARAAAVPGAHWFGQIAQVSLSDFGDFLAGVFAPLAFFWLAVSVFTQRIELRSQIRELSEQKIELKNNAEATMKIMRIHEDNLKSQTKKLKQELFEYSLNTYRMIIEIDENVELTLSDNSKILIKLGFRFMNGPGVKLNVGHAIDNDIDHIVNSCKRNGTIIVRDSNFERLERIYSLLEEMRNLIYPHDENYTIYQSFVSLDLNIIENAIRKLVIDKEI